MGIFRPVGLIRGVISGRLLQRGVCGVKAVVPRLCLHLEPWAWCQPGRTPGGAAFRPFKSQETVRRCEWARVAAWPGSGSRPGGQAGAVRQCLGCRARAFKVTAGAVDEGGTSVWHGTGQDDVGLYMVFSLSQADAPEHVHSVASIILLMVGLVQGFRVGGSVRPAEAGEGGGWEVAGRWLGGGWEVAGRWLGHIYSSFPRVFRLR